MKADVHKVLGSVHKMNKGGNIVVLDGQHRYMKNKHTGQKTKISDEDGQYIMYMWVPAGPKEAEKDTGYGQPAEGEPVCHLGCG